MYKYLLVIGVIFGAYFFGFDIGKRGPSGAQYWVEVRQGNWSKVFSPMTSLPKRLLSFGDYDSKSSGSANSAYTDSEYYEGYARIRDRDVWITYEKIGDLAILGDDMIIGAHEEVQRYTHQKLLTAAQSTDVPEVKSIAGQRAYDNLRTKLFNPWDRFGEPRNDIAIKIGTNVWPATTIPYFIDSSITDAVLKKGIEDAAKAVSDQTIITLRKKTDNDLYWLTFKHPEDKNGTPYSDTAFKCWAYPGYHEPIAGSVVALTPACVKRNNTNGTVIHEITHALGAIHEQMRPGREKYLDIESFADPDKCDSSIYACNDGLLKANFGEVKLGKNLSTYDLCSIMHYSPRQSPERMNWFSLTAVGQKEFDKCKADLPEKCREDMPGQRCSMSKLDKDGINALYKGAPNTAP